MSNIITLPKIECQSVTKFYDDFKAVDQADLSISTTEVLVILGPSGSGKSTFLRIIAGLEDLDSGNVFFEGNNISNPDSYVPADKRKMGMIFQDIALFPHLNIADNIAFGLKGSKPFKQGKVKELRSLIDLDGYGPNFPHELSGGEQQRVAIARALAPSPDVLLMDEPFSSLDTELRIQLRHEVRKILKKAGIGAILVTHDQEEAFNFADWIIVMKSGKIIQNGLPAEIYHDPCSHWVASFVGDCNFIKLPAEKNKSQSYLNEVFEKENISEKTELMVRPENIQVQPCESATDAHGKITDINFFGNKQVLSIEMKTGEQIKAAVSSWSYWKENQVVTLEISHHKVF